MIGIADEVDALAVSLIEAAGDEKRTTAIALRMVALAVRIHQQEGAMIPPHLREVPAALPAGVTRLPARRARA